MSSIEQLFSCFEEHDINTKESRSSLLNDTIKRKRSSTGGDSHNLARKSNLYEEPSQKILKHDILEDDIDLNTLKSHIDVHIIAKNSGCLHEVAVPSNQKFIALKHSKLPPAKEYKFTLDPFQKQAILCIENNQSVMVSAHTSAGKTVVAEYVIARALQNKQRVIYTTPIKALSNQKYRELLEEFKDVGIMTGDVTINPVASCLIMTTEILRSMLFRGSEITKEVGWVIFDEIHYMRDNKRGFIWEETLILLPDNVRYAFLSATIPNARQFAEWVSQLHQQPCNVVYTEYRPTPLQHYIFPAGGDGMHLVIDENGNLNRNNFDAAMSVIDSNNRICDDNQNANKKEYNMKEKDYIFDVVKVLMERNLAPLIVFSFSKKTCEINAKNLGRLNFNTPSETVLVNEVFENAINILTEDEKKLPQIVRILPLLRRGIAYHHSGLLPLIKETVEILFGEGLIKALFATETFAMGLNMPAKTVFFTTVKKFDGVNSRFISSGEYIQMSGRAGRRGLDEKGTVILMIDEAITPEQVQHIMMGKTDPLNSAFHLTYSMILNLFRQEEINPEYMIDKSFLIFQTREKLRNLYSVLKKQQEKYHSTFIKNESQIMELHETKQKVKHAHECIRPYIVDPKYVMKFLHQGRLIKIKNETDEYDWGIIVSCQRYKKIYKSIFPKIKLEVMLHVTRGEVKDGDILPKPYVKGKKNGYIGIFPVDHKLIYQISNEVVHLPISTKRGRREKAFLTVLRQLNHAYPEGLPLLHPINDMGLRDPKLPGLLKNISNYERLLHNHPLYDSPDCNDLCLEYEFKGNLLNDINDTKREIQAAKSLLKMDELLSRKNILRTLGYCNETDVINIKGRVACELSSADELVLTELIFSGAFTKLSPDLCVAIASCFVCAEYDTDVRPIHNILIQETMLTIRRTAMSIGDVALEAKVIISKEEYIDSFQTNLIEIIIAWCRGASFLEICKMTEIYEGSIIRYMRMLEEVLCELCRASKNIGNTDLENRFSEGIRLLKRGVAFAGSLYL